MAYRTSNKDIRKKMFKEKVKEIMFRAKFPKGGHGTTAGGVVGPLGWLRARLSKKARDFKQKLKGDFPD